ncbi:MAG: protein kinase [Planctomycetes bacterium]|nr:protein kinase [Planctomycetota bacterium]
MRIGREIAEGLAAAHEAGLVHRDIKPGNVWLEGARRRVKILDFGLARITGAPAGAADPQTASGAFLGTPAYMSPEQARSQPTDYRTDLFSLGVVLYQMATGTMPFTGPSTFDVLAAVVSHDPPPAHEVTLDVPPALSELIRRLMAKNPGGRPRSAGAVAEELAAIGSGLAALPVQVIPLGDVPGAPNPWADITPTERDEAEEEATVRLDRASPRRGAPKWLWPAAAVGLVAVVVLVWGAVAALKPKRRPQPEPVKADPPPLRPIGPGARVPPATPDRPAAEALLRDRVRVQVREPDGRIADVRPGDDLPDGPFELIAVIVPAEPPRRADFVATVLKPAIGPLKALAAVVDEGHVLRWSESDVVWLTEAPFGGSLTDLVTEFPLTERTARALGGLPALRRLDCGGERTDDAALVALAKGKALGSLNLRAVGADRPVTEKGWEALAGLPLRDLLLDGPKTIDLRACELFGKMPRLEKLRLVGPRLGEPELLALSKAPALAVLELSDCHIPDAALVHLAALPRLHSLDLDGNPLTDTGLEHLRGAARLRVLNLQKTRVTGAGATRLAAALPACEIAWGEGKVIGASKKADAVPRPTGGLGFDGNRTNVTLPGFRFDGKLPITVEAWVTPGAVRYAHFVLLGDRGGIGTSGDNKFGAGFYDGAKWQNGYGRDALKVGETAHVAAVVKSDRIVLYVNGKPSGTKDGLALGGLRANESPGRIGAALKGGDGSKPFQGTVHGIRVSRGVRYDKDFSPAVTWDADADTVALYRFDEGTGTTLKDHSGNGYDGVIEDGTWIAPKKP